MIPLRDTIRSRTIPVVNYVLIAMCGVVFLVELSMGDAVDGFIYRYGAVPVNVWTSISAGDFSPANLYPLLTSIFLHGGWMHLLGNMLFLYVFGDNVEDRLGHAGYLLFFLMCGIGAALIETWVQRTSTIPLIGASGAIAGVLGAYFLLYPRARILTLVPLFVFFPVIELSAFVFLGFWFVMQFLQGALTYGIETQGGVAWWAHAGGFVVGGVLLPAFLLLSKPFTGHLSKRRTGL
jgi:membrane associated rhomboid family serine protease